MRVSERSKREKIAIWRLSVLGSVITKSPAIARSYLEEIANSKDIVHPIKQVPVALNLRTLQRWYKKVRECPDPLDALKPKSRKDKGSSRVFDEEIKSRLLSLYKDYSHFDRKLLYDNLEANLKELAITSYLPSYSTIRRFLNNGGFLPMCEHEEKRKTALQRKRINGSPRYESEYVGGIVHTDFHVGSIQIANSSGILETAFAVAFIDDRSRYILHIQWYIKQTCENISHAAMQAILRRGIPRCLMSDNGSQMIAGEFKDGLENLGILFQRSLPYSPWSNGKIESFWNPLENRLLKMLKKVRGLNLIELNNLTQIWLEEDYHKSHHSELGDSPRQIFIRGKNVFRPSPSFESIRKCFRMTVTRRQKMSDHSLCVDGVRYQIPKEYWHIPELRLRYARWDLSEIDIIGDQDTVIATIYPINKVLNADKNYKNIQLMREKIEDVLPPLLRQQYLNQKEKQNFHQYIPKDQ